MLCGPYGYENCVNLVPYRVWSLVKQHLPVVPCRGSWLAQAAILSLPLSLSKPSQPQPEPWTATVAADIFSFIFWNEPKSRLIASSRSPAKQTNRTLTVLDISDLLIHTIWHDLTLWFSSTIWWQVCPEYGVINMTTTVKFQCGLKGHLGCDVTWNASGKTH